MFEQSFNLANDNNRKTVMNIPRIYLAGPEVFFPNSQMMGEDMKFICARSGAIGLFPHDNQANVFDPNMDQMAQNIYQADIDLLTSSHAIIANLNRFRGPSMDPGTIFEIGYGCALGKLVVGWTTDNRTYGQKVAQHFDINYEQINQKDEWRDPEGMLCKDFGLTENLMIAKGVEQIFPNFLAAVNYVVKRLKT